VYGSTTLFTMTIHILESLLLIGSVIAAAAVAVVCGLGLVVWLAGGHFHSRFK
jgi:hypothetical protein